MMLYENIQPPFTLDFPNMTKAELKAYGKWFLQIKPARIAILSSAVRETPGFEDWQPDYSPESLLTLGEWFASQVQTEPRSQEEIKELESQLTIPIEVPKEDLSIRTYSLAMDIGMYLGEVIISNVPDSKWEQKLKGGKTNADYGQMILYWPSTPLPMNTIWIVVTIAHRMVYAPSETRGVFEAYKYWTESKRDS